MCVMDWGFPLRTSRSQCCRDSISVSQALCILGMTHWGIQQQIKKTNSRHPADSSDHLRFAKGRQKGSPRFVPSCSFSSDLCSLFSGTQRARRGILMPRGKNCRETIFAAHLPRNYPHHRGNFERGKNVLYCGGEAIWEAFQETILARVIESQKLPRDSGESIFAAMHQDVSQGPLGIPQFVPISSDLFSEQTEQSRETPFQPTPFASRREINQESSCRVWGRKQHKHV